MHYIFKPMQQITNTILMIRPVNFRKNEQTAVNNYFQEDINLKNSEVNAKAQKEFDAFVDKLRGVGVNVIVVDDLKTNDTPDSILDRLEEEGYHINNIMDYTSAEKDNFFLEGTGSILLDRVNSKAYCALSPRADEELFIEFCEDFEYTPIVFKAYQNVEGKRLPIYHTNVMMCLGEKFSVICLDSIDDKKERKNVIHHLNEDGKEIIEISESQMHQFAGNMLQVKGENDKRYLVMSKAAHDSLSASQISRLKRHSEILSSDLTVIETCGGGSARCMMAEVFLPKG